MSIENPPAFPLADPTHGSHYGMTLRDYFAGQALASFSAVLEPELDALYAYRIADAMLAHRQKSPTDE